VAAARAARPDTLVEDRVLRAYVLERMEAGAIPPEQHAGDLALACACTYQVSRGMDEFQRTYVPVIARVVARRAGASATGEDAVQTVLEKLLVPQADAAPAIAKYRGRGPLRSWVSTTAATTLAMLFRSEGRRREQSIEPELLEFAHQADPELARLAEQYKPEVEEAVREALQRLGERERLLLRLNVGEGMSIDQLGAMYSVNRATAARWLVAAKRTLALSAGQLLRERLKVSESECHSLLKLVRSQLDVSVLRHLR
jgi:RNA polymerase sigma-70 factor (ECF subfamily)